MKKYVYLFVFSVFIVLISFKAQSAFFNADEFYLKNKLRVIISENHKAPIAKMMLFYKVGSMDEPKGKGGLAHLLEHLMFRGTSNLPASNFNQIMHKNGADFNAFTSKDMTVYHALVDLSRLELVLALEADRMFHLQISDEAFEGEQKIVLEERKERVDNKPKSRFFEDIQKILWQNTPYEHPISGTEDEIKNLSKEDALEVYQTYYTPENAVLVVVGDVTKEDVKILAEKYFALDKKPVKALPEKRSFSLFSNGQYIIQKEMADVEVPTITRSYIIPSVFDNPKKAFAMEVFSHYFGESQNSYLKQHLIKTNLAVDASSSVQTMARGSGVFSVTVLPQDKTDIQSYFNLLDKIIQQAVLNLTPEIIEKEKKKMLSTLVFIKDNPEDEAYILGYLATLGLSLDEIENYPKWIENVTLNDVQTTVSEVLKNAKQVTSVLTPLSEVANEPKN